MMYPKRRKIPIEVAVWTQKDVTVQKPTVSSGMMPNDTRYNVFCRRKFYDNLLNLSFERHRKIARCDFGTKTFLKKQRQKAEKAMPGLLPYVEPFREETEDLSLATLSSSRIDPFSSPSHQSTKNNSILQSQSILPSLPKIPNRKPSTISRLSQPKSHTSSGLQKDHIRFNQVKQLTTEELFGNINDQIGYESSLPKIQERSSNDRRFQRLIYLFSDMHERDPSTIQSVHTLAQLNSALKHRPDSRKRTTESSFDLIEEGSEVTELRSDSLDSKTDVYLINACA